MTDILQVAQPPDPDLRMTLPNGSLNPACPAVQAAIVAIEATFTGKFSPTTSRPPIPR